MDSCGVWSLTSITEDPTAEAIGLPPKVLKWRDLVMLDAISVQKNHKESYTTVEVLTPK